MYRLCVVVVLLLATFHETDAANNDCSYRAKITADDQVERVFFGDREVALSGAKNSWSTYTKMDLKYKNQWLKSGYISIQARNCHVIKQTYWCWKGWWRSVRCTRYICNPSKNPSMLMGHFDSMNPSGIDFVTEPGYIEVPVDNYSKGRWRCTEGGKSGGKNVLTNWHLAKGKSYAAGWANAYGHSQRWGNGGHIGELRRLKADPIWVKNNNAGGSHRVWCRADDFCGMCNIYGFSRQSTVNVNMASGGCVDAGNLRTIKCHDGFGHNGMVTNVIQLRNSAAFRGCKPINECHASTSWGFGNVDKHTGFWKCVDGANKRTIYCKAGYSPSSFVINGRTRMNQQSKRCTDNNECALYGFSGHKTGIDTCKNSAVNKRTVSCKPGYYVRGTPAKNYIRSITLTGSSKFSGCSDLNECAVHPYKPDNVLNCKNTGINQRTISCKPGFFINGKTHSETSVVLTGTQHFTGCEKKDECTIHGFNGKDANTKECIDQVASRVLVCDDGYWVKGTRSDRQTRNKDQVFDGCVDIDECKEYGYKKDSKVLSCDNKRNSRTITCKPGYYVNGQQNNAVSVTLTGSAPFTSCQDVDECTLYGTSGNDDLSPTCTQPSPNVRRITCKPGSEIIGGKRATFIDLTGNAFFKGCRDINECTRFPPDEDKKANIKSCENKLNSRTITCDAGYKTGGKDDASITLEAGAKFGGCEEIDECLVYQPTNPGVGFAECVDKVNKREVTCKAGYTADGEADDAITLIGNAPFEGCADIDECAVYGYSIKALEYHGCYKDMEERTMEHWAIKDATDLTIEGCRAACTGYVFFGLQNGNECFCSKTLHKKLSVKNAECNKPCTGDKDEMCGGEWRNAVYEVDEQGRKQDDVESCQTLEINSRVITCKEGFVTGTDEGKRVTAVTLISNAEFLGCSPVCGDGKKVHHEICDDGNTVSGDGCAGFDDNSDTLACTVEKGWEDCDHKCKPTCGDGLIRGDETCDHKTDQGCNAETCRAIAGWACKEGEVCEASVCGDGLQLGKEQCDDGNTEDGDGCSASCIKEEGWVCAAGSRCCHTWKSGINDEHVDQLATQFYSQLVCHDSYWIPKVGDDVLVYVPHGLTLTHDMKIGGNVVISRNNPTPEEVAKAEDEDEIEADEDEAKEKEEKEKDEEEDKEKDEKEEDKKRHEHHEDLEDLDHEWRVTVSSHITIAGTLTIDDNTGIIFTESGSIRMEDATDHHKNDVDFPNPRTNHKQLYLSGGQIRVHGLDYDEMELDHDDHHLGIDFFITMSGCPDVTHGSFYLDAVSIPHGSNPLPLIRTDNVCHGDHESDDEFDDLDHMLPGSCSNIDDHFNGGHGSDDDHHHSELNIDVNHRSLCGGQIAGIVLGCFFGALLLIALIFFVMSGGGGVSDDYQAL